MQGLRRERGNKLLGQRLRSARLRAGLSQEALGVGAGIAEDSASARLSGYESGSHTPALETMERLALVLKIPAAYFYARQDALAELIDTYGRLSKDDQARILKSAKACLKAVETKNTIPLKSKI